MRRSFSLLDIAFITTPIAKKPARTETATRGISDATKSVTFAGQRRGAALAQRTVADREAAAAAELRRRVTIRELVGADGPVRYGEALRRCETQRAR
jgi:hypothetical protein